jgi:hypothetical protein
MALLGRMGRLNGKSRKAMICAPKAFALKFNMCGMLLTKNYTIDESNHVHFRNISKVRRDVERVQGALKELRYTGYCGVSHRLARPCYTTEKRPIEGNIGRQNLSRLNQIAQTLGL